MWSGQLVKKDELGKAGNKIFQLAKETRAGLDPFVFAGSFYKKTIELIGRDERLLSLCTAKELERYLGGRLTPKARKYILQRDNGWVVFGRKSHLVKTFNEVQDFVKQFGFRVEEEKAVSEKVKEFRGQVASKGKAKGVVKTLFRYQDNHKVKKGDVLVSPMTTPAFMSAIVKCAAIVTDEGGITCHAAIVSRELGIPCIIGTKIATQVLKDGDMVEVDAEKGVVKILEKSSS